MDAVGQQSGSQGVSGQALQGSPIEGEPDRPAAIDAAAGGTGETVPFMLAEFASPTL